MQEQACCQQRRRFSWSMTTAVHRTSEWDLIHSVISKPLDSFSSNLSWMAYELRKWVTLFASAQKQQTLRHRILRRSIVTQQQWLFMLPWTWYLLQALRWVIGRTHENSLQEWSFHVLSSYFYRSRWACYRGWYRGPSWHNVLSTRA